MEQIIPKEEFERMMSAKGEIRGATLKAYADFIAKEEGEKALKRVENEMSALGYPIKYRELEKMDFYPIGLHSVTLEIIKRLFDYDEKKFREIGRFVSKISLVLKFFLKYFVSGERLTREIPKIWRKNYTVGDLEIGDYNEGEKYMTLELRNFKTHPLHGQVLVGYFSTVGKMLGGSTVVEEKKSPFKGDDCYEFLLTW